MLTADLALDELAARRQISRVTSSGTRSTCARPKTWSRSSSRTSGRARASLEESLQEYVGTGTDYKILRGLIKLLTDRCEFETSSPVEPTEIRRALFLKARRITPSIDEESRAELFAESARELRATPRHSTARSTRTCPRTRRSRSSRR
jgi:predicted nuclease of restriction endonuclease-like RecB superfamily